MTKIVKKLMIKINENVKTLVAIKSLIYIENTFLSEKSLDLIVFSVLSWKYNLNLDLNLYWY